MRPTRFPKINDVTMINPTKITDMGVYVQLIEYNNIEGFIPFSELSKFKKIRSINKIIKIGKKIPAVVLSIDDKKFITLSKKMISIEENNNCEKNYKSLKFVYDLINFFVKKLEKDHQVIMTIDDAYEKFIWSLSDNIDQVLSHLKSASKDFENIYGVLPDIDPNIIDCYKKILGLKFKISNILLEAVLEISCYESGGINVIKSALVKASEMATPEYPFKIKLIKSPYYSITIRTSSPDPVIQLITNVISTIKNDLESYGASMKIIKLPEVVVDKEYQVEESDDEETDDIDDE